MNKVELAKEAALAAARLRANLGVGPGEAVCPFDIAEKLEVPARLVALPSLEGIYSPEPSPSILVSVERPAGRRRFTCSHEIGHHVFGHGLSLDELAGDAAMDATAEEFLAQRFAAALLMPKLVVESAFARRGWSIPAATPDMIFIVAQELGVGFTTLVGHLEQVLHRLTRGRADEHRRVPLANLRRRVAGFEVEHDAIVVDEHWSRRTVDVEVGDVMLLPPTAEIAGSCASLVSTPVRHLVVRAPGHATVSLQPNQPTLVIRSSRRHFTGLARYRHLEDFTDVE